MIDLPMSIVASSSCPCAKAVGKELRSSAQATSANVLGSDFMYRNDERKRRERGRVECNIFCAIERSELRVVGEGENYKCTGE